MKTLLYSFIAITTLFLASCTPNNPQPNPNSTSTSWKFKVSINGVTHKAEGNTLNLNSNFCAASSNWTITGIINDKTAASYISGDHGGFTLNLTNPSLGVNPYLGYSLTLNGPMVTNSSGALGLNLPINLTSLGLAGNGNYQNSQPVKGNYSGTLYFQSSLVPASGFDTPVTIDIDFVAMRP
jgi:hypothetical protein